MDAFQFMESLDDRKVAKLYEDPWAVQAVFQSLPALAKQFVLRILCMDRAVEESTLQRWMEDPVAHSKTFTDALTKTQRLRVIFLSDGNISLSPVFQEKLKIALSNLGGSPWEVEGQVDPQGPSKKYSASQIEQVSRAKWDSVLHFMVGSKEVPDPPQAVVDILLQTGLMESKDKRSFHITSSGYEFMLTDVHAQMWVFILEYIKTLSRSDRISEEDILAFLFQLSYCRTGIPYPVQHLNQIQRMILQDFVNFGLLFKRSSQDHFYATNLALNLVFGGIKGQTRKALTLSNSFSQVRSGMKSHGGVIEFDASSQMLVVVETNFKVYAYTTSSLHIAMLSVFVDIVTRLPNLAVGFITRESLRSALMHGISAQQIYDFIMKHAHPKMKRNNPVIPENIADQLYLWEKERNRISFSDAVLYDGFNTKAEFEQVFKYCKNQKILTWYDPVHLKLTVAPSAEQLVNSFIRNTLGGH